MHLTCIQRASNVHQTFINCKSIIDLSKAELHHVFDFCNFSCPDSAGNYRLALSCSPTAVVATAAKCRISDCLSRRGTAIPGEMHVQIASFAADAHEQEFAVALRVQKLLAFQAAAQLGGGDIAEKGAVVHPAALDASAQPPFALQISSMRPGRPQFPNL